MITKKDVNQIVEIVEGAVEKYWSSPQTITDMFAHIRKELEEMRTQNKRK